MNNNNNSPSNPMPTTGSGINQSPPGSPMSLSLESTPRSSPEAKEAKSEEPRAPRAGKRNRDSSSPAEGERPTKRPKIDPKIESYFTERLAKLDLTEQLATVRAESLQAQMESLQAQVESLRAQMELQQQIIKDARVERELLRNF